MIWCIFGYGVYDDDALGLGGHFLPIVVVYCGLIFFSSVETYFDVFKLQKSFVTCINPRSEIHTRRKYKWYLSAHLLVTLVTPVGTPLSGSTPDNTCIRINLDFLKPFIDKPIGRLTAIVPPKKTLENILSSIWVVG
jgi:hypothetical protein